MEVHFTPEMEKKLDELAAHSGRATADELAQTRETLDTRYDDLKTGRVKLIPGDEVEAHFREKSAAARRLQPRS